MKKLILLFIAISTSILSVNAINPESNKKNDDGVIELFNGKDLDGWYTYVINRGRNVDPKGVFTVKDGLIRISGEEWGCITTDKEYEDYKITLRYKWGKETFGSRKNSTRDSGLLFHSIGEDGASSKCWMRSIEVNLLEGRTGDFIVVGDGQDEFALTSKVVPFKDGKGNVFDPVNGVEKTFVGNGRVDWINIDRNWKDVTGFVGENDVEYANGEWNIMECIVIKDEVYVFVNGQFINHATNVRPTKGKIQIQSEGAEIFFSNITIKEL